jgi:hypothetical protein
MMMQSLFFRPRSSSLYRRFISDDVLKEQTTSPLSSILFAAKMHRYLFSIAPSDLNLYDKPLLERSADHLVLGCRHCHQ